MTEASRFFMDRGSAPPTFVTRADSSVCISNHRVLIMLPFNSFGISLALSCALAAPMAIALPVSAQAPAIGAESVPPPQVITTASGEVTLVPDRGYVSFSVEQRAPTAAAAGSQNAKLQGQVIAALRAKGVAAEHITTTSYSVEPDVQYPKGERRLVGYVARNTVVVDVQKIEQMGILIDTALTAGANDIGQLRYYSTVADSARRDALAIAVSKARADAAVIARAAGASLGPAIEVMVNDQGGPRPTAGILMSARIAEDASPTPISVGEQKISVSITARWALLPPG